MSEDQLWDDAMKMHERRDHARQKLNELADWASWDKQKGTTALVYLTLMARIRNSTEDEIDAILDDMQSRIDMLMLNKLSKNL